MSSDVTLSQLRLMPLHERDKYLALVPDSKLIDVIFQLLVSASIPYSNTGREGNIKWIKDVLNGSNVSSESDRDTASQTAPLSLTFEQLIEEVTKPTKPKHTLLHETLDAPASTDLATIPGVTIDNFSPVETHTTTWEPIDQGVSKYKLRRMDFKEASIVVAAMKGQDALSVKKLSDGRISISIADGVSGSLYPAEAAQNIVSMLNSIISELKTSDLSNDIVWKAIHTSVKAALLKEHFNQRAQKDLENLWSTWQNDPNPTAQRAFLRHSRYYDAGAIAVSTSVGALYSRTEKVVMLSMIGDSYCVVFNPNGLYQQYTAQSTVQMSPRIDLNVSSSTNYDVHLEDKEIIMVCTDGVDPSALEKISKTIKQNPNHNYTQAELAQILHQHYIDSGLDDDATAVFIQHHI